MANIIQCQAKAESCDGDSAESRQQSGGEGAAQGQQQGAGADQAGGAGNGPGSAGGEGGEGGESSCPLTGGGGGEGGGETGTAPAPQGGEGGHAECSAGGGEAQAANDEGGACGPEGEEAEQGGGGGSPPVPPVQPLGVETPKPLGDVLPREETLALAAPLVELSLAGLEFPKEQTDENADTKNRAIRDVQSAFAGVRREAEVLLEKHRAAGAASIASIGEAFVAVDEEMRADHLRLDDRLMVRHQGLVFDLHGHKDEALGRLAGGRGGARMAIFRARNAGTQALQRKLDNTSDRITEIVELAVLPYRQILEEAVGAVRTEITSAEDTLRSWKSGILGRFPLFADTRMEGAANEGRRETADCRVDEELPKLRCKGEQLTSTFEKLIDPFEQHARNSLEPSMRAEGDRACQCGFDAIQQAADSSVEAVDESYGAGRDWIKSQAAASERQLTQMLNASRMALRDQVGAKRNHLRQEAEQGRRRIAEAHDNQQLGLSDSLSSYRDSVESTAPSGQQAFRSTGVTGAGETREAFAELAGRYRDNADQIEDGARTGLTTGRALFSEEAGATVDRQQFTAWQALNEARMRTDDGIDQRIDGMYKLKTGVEQTANQWSMDYAERFSSLIDQTWEQIDQCEPTFQGRVDAKRDEIDAWVSQRQDPDILFQPDLDEVAEKVQGDVEERSGKLEDELEDLHVSDSTVVAAIRGVTWAQGRAVTEHYESLGGSLVADIIDGLSGDDESAALAYLRGDQAEGAEYELKASIHWYNDDEARIRATLRSLDDEQLQQFIDRPGVQSTISSVRGNLGGVDRDVFDTLIRTDFPNNETRLAHADTQDLEYKLSQARNREEMNRELTNFYSNAQARGYGSHVSNDDLRRLMNDRMAHVRNVTDDDGNIVSGAAADRVVANVVDERVAQLDRMRCGPRGCENRYRGAYGEQLQRRRGAQQDLTAALISHGVGSNEERIARLGIEATRRGGGRMENIDQHLVDQRLNPEPPELEPSRYADGQVPQEVRDRVEARRAQALADREAVLRGVAKRYGDNRSAAAGDTAAQVSDLLGRGQNRLGRDVISGLVNDNFPSPETTALVLEYSAVGASGTNEALMKQATRRLNRNQIAAAAAVYDGEYDSLWDLVESETSGQDFLDMELAWMGRPRNARERAEVALMAAHQQRREVGFVGEALMGGSRTDRRFRADEDRLRGLVGGSVSFSRRGQPPSVTIRNGAFDELGRFTGEGGEVALNVAARSTRSSAERYAKNIDEWASAITTTIAIIGAVVATVVTGGGASPLLAAAIAGAIGGASMLTNHVIRGGRYGWEEALTDLGMTGVQMLTAGLGQKLQAVAAASKTMGPIQQALLPAVVTGGLDSLGQTALSDATWSNGFEAGIGEVLAGTVRGVLTSSVAALGTQALQKIPIGRAAGAVDDIADGAGDLARSPAWRTLGDVAGDSTSMLSRSAAQSLSSAGGAFVSRGAELGFESMRGRYNGDAGDFLTEMSKSAGQAALQGLGEGSGEALRDRHRISFGLYTRPGWMDPGEYQQLRDAHYGTGDTTSGDSSVPDTSSGTAAGIAGSRFRGDLHDAPTVRDTDVHGALADLTGDGGPLQGRVRPGDGEAGDRAVIDLGDGGGVEIRFRVVDDMAPVDGEVPVARFDPRPEGGFEVKISSRADPELIGRALAHELTEIRALQRPDAAQRVADGDLLRPGTARRFDGDAPPKLSPHDQGRIAESEWLARRIAAEETKTPPDTARVRGLQEEMHNLLAHLGVVGEGQGPSRRRDAMLESLSDPRLRSAIESGVQGARENPRLRHQGIDHEAALRDMGERWRQAKAVGDEGAAQGLLRQIHRTLMRMERIHTDQRLTRKQQQRMDDGAADVIGDPKLAAAVRDLVRSEFQVREGHLRNDPAEADPDSAQAVRREYADRVHFQDWPEFRQKYFDTFATRDANNPVHMNRAYFDWVAGGYVSTDSGRLRSVVSGVRRPDPGFEAQWLGGVRPRPDQAARLDPADALTHDLGGVKALVDQGMVRTGDLSPELKRRIDDIAGVDDPSTSTVGEAADLRHRLLAEARRLDERRRQPGLDPDEALRLRELHHALEHQAIRLAESLGEAAAHRVARESVPGDWEPVTFPGSGSGLPDVVYRHRETGQLLILEAKGGTSTLGTRRDVHGRVRVEQGTRPYLDSLAAEMRRSDSKTVRDLGAEIQRQLAVPDGIDYRVVKQPFDAATGRPLTPESGRFDLGTPPGAAQQGHRSAAPVPESGFHGEVRGGRGRVQRVIDWALGRALTSRRARRGAAEWIGRGEGIGSSITPRRGRSGVFDLEVPGQPKVQVQVDVVPATQLPKHGDRRANAEWDPPPPSYRIKVSADMDPAQVERALAHEFREIHETVRGADPHRGGDAGESNLALDSPHGRARVEEVNWLLNRMAAGDPDGSHRTELDAVLRHLGAEEPVHPRRGEILAQMQELGLPMAAAWRALGGDGLLPSRQASRRQAEDAARQIRAGSDEDSVLFQRIEDLAEHAEALRSAEGAPPPDLGEVLAERAALIERIREAPPARPALEHAYQALGLEPPVSLADMGVQHFGPNQAALLRLAEASGLDTRHQVTVDGARYSFTDPIEIQPSRTEPGVPGRGRLAVLVVVDDGQTRTLRTFYTSGSQGIFRVLPAHNDKVTLTTPDGREVSIPGYDKGFGEHALGLPSQVQAALGRLVEDGSVRLDIGRKRAADLAYNAGRVNRGEAEFRQYYNAPEHIRGQVTEEPLVAPRQGPPSHPEIVAKHREALEWQGLLDDQGLLARERGKALQWPEDVQIPPAQMPVLDQPLREFRTRSTGAGEVTGRVFRSDDGTLEYIFFEGADGRVWVGDVTRVRDENGAPVPITSFGVRARVPQPDEVTTPLWEYPAQIPGLYRDDNKPTRGPYADNWAYVRQLPIVRAYYAQRYGTEPPP